MTPKHRTRIALSLSAAAALLVVAAPGRAQDSPGRQMFTRYCGSCHGPDGKGDGMLAGMLTQRPADLTQIAKNNGGTFPAQKVMRYIDGTTGVRAHGSSEMPVWGEVFKEELADSPAQKAEVRTKILEIVGYIASIQQK
ncbi:MAG: c-type cytochrome [Thermodesulfobacteriota bacterium]